MRYPPDTPRMNPSASLRPLRLSCAVAYLPQMTESMTITRDVLVCAGCLPGPHHPPCPVFESIRRRPSPPWLTAMGVEHEF
jgi:hypothetical protein